MNHWRKGNQKQDNKLSFPAAVEIAHNFWDFHFFIVMVFRHVGSQLGSIVVSFTPNVPSFLCEKQESRSNAKTEQILIVPSCALYPGGVFENIKNQLPDR